MLVTNVKLLPNINFLFFFYFSKSSEQIYLPYKLGYNDNDSKWGAGSRWSFGPNSACGSIETTTIRKTHYTLLFQKKILHFCSSNEIWEKWNLWKNPKLKFFSSRMTFRNFNFSKNIFRHPLVNGNFGTMKRDEFNINQNIIQL